MKSRHTTVFFRWFSSYLLILIIPILLSIGIYTYSFQSTKAQTNKVNDALMEQVKIEIDNHIKEINKLFNWVALDNNVQIASNIQNQFTAKDQLLLYNLVKNLQALNLTDEFITDNFIFFNHTQTVLSINGHMSGELFYHLYYESDDLNLQQFQEFMSASHASEIQPIHKVNGQDMLLFVQSTLDSNIGESSASIVIAIYENKLQKLLENMKWDDQIGICILDSKNNIISTTQPMELDNTFDYNKLEDGSGFYKNIMGKRYAVSVNSSKNIDWKYISLTPVYLFEKNARSIQLFTIIGLFICVFVGAFFSYVLAKTNYNPLKSLLDIFKKQSDSTLEHNENEYQWLEVQTKKFFKEQADTQHILWNNKKLLKNYYIFKLLEYPYEEKNGLGDLQKYDINLHSEYHVVVMFSIKEYNSSTDGTEIYEQNHNTLKFIIINMFEEAAGSHFNVETTDVGENVVAIVNLPENNKELLSLLEETIYFVQQKITEYSFFHIIALVGDVQSGMEGIHSSYLAANEAGEYVQLLGRQEIIYYDDIKNAQRRYVYPIETEQKIINAIKVGDSVAAGKYINQVFEINYSENNISMDIGRCLLFDMMGTIIKGADLGGCADVLEEMDFTRQLSAKLPITEIESRLQKIVDAICSHILKQHKENENDKQLSKKIMDYINENYQNPDLNISQTGLHFNITPAYISALFKEQTGESLLEYINAVKINAAQELLKQGYSIVEISQMVGFRNSGSLIRVFKKITGVTPGQFKTTY